VTGQSFIKITRQNTPIKDFNGVLATSLTHASAKFGVAIERQYRISHAARIVGVVDYQSRLAINNRIVTAAGTTGHDGDAAGRGLDKDDAEALLL